MNSTPIEFQVTWLTSRPLLRGNRVAIALSAAPAACAIVALIASIRAPDASRGPILLSAALFMSLSATLIQLPSFAGRIILDHDTLTVVTPLAGKRGRRIIPREAIERAFYTPLERPPDWLPFIWVIAEVLVVIGSLRGDGWHWTWRTAFVLGLSFWPLMVARWRAAMQVVLVYSRPGTEQPGLILAWTTPHELRLTLCNQHVVASWQRSF